MSEPAQQASETLAGVVASPYEGSLSVTATMDDQASASMASVQDAADGMESASRSASTAVDDTGQSASSAGSQLSMLSSDANQSAQGLDRVDASATSASSSLDGLSASQGDAATSASDVASNSSDASAGLSDAGAAAQTADVSVRGATGGIRALRGLMLPLAKDAGMSATAAKEVGAGMGVMAAGTRLAGGGLAAVGGLLAAIPGWGWAAIGAAVALGAAYKTNFLGARDAVHYLSNELQGLNTAQGRVSQIFTATQASSDRLKTAKQTLASATDTEKNAARDLESALRGEVDAKDRIITTEHGLEAAKTGAARAWQNEIEACARLTELQKSGTASQEEITDATLSYREAQDATHQAADQVNQATKDNSRSTKDASDAADIAGDAFGKETDALGKAHDAASDVRTAQDDLANSAAALAGAMQSMSAESSYAFQAMRASADQELAQVKADLDQADPTKRNSPSLVDKVEMGANQIIHHYARINKETASRPMAPAAPIPNVTAVAGETRVAVDLKFNDRRLQDIIVATVREVIGGGAIGRSRSDLSGSRLVPR